MIEICDMFDALCSDRPYRNKINKTRAVEIIECVKGIFGPELKDILFKNIRKSLKWGKS